MEGELPNYYLCECRIKSNLRGCSVNFIENVLEPAVQFCLKISNIVGTQAVAGLDAKNSLLKMLFKFLTNAVNTPKKKTKNPYFYKQNPFISLGTQLFNKFLNIDL